MTKKITLLMAFSLIVLWITWSTFAIYQQPEGESVENPKVKTFKKPILSEEAREKLKNSKKDLNQWLKENRWEIKENRQEFKENNSIRAFIETLNVEDKKEIIDLLNKHREEMNKLREEQKIKIKENWVSEELLKTFNEEHKALMEKHLTELKALIPTEKLEEFNKITEEAKNLFEKNQELRKVNLESRTEYRKEKYDAKTNGFVNMFEKRLDNVEKKLDTKQLEIVYTKLIEKTDNMIKTMETNWNKYSEDRIVLLKWINEKIKEALELIKISNETLEQTDILQ